MTSKLCTLSEAVATHVRDGDTVILEGFTHLIPFAAAHEIIRQGRRDLTLVRLTPDLIYDQMIAAGCCRTLVFSWAGNPGVGSLHAFRRAVEQGIPSPIAIEEYSHFALAMRLFAGASGLPFIPLRSLRGSDLPGVNPSVSTVTCPFTGETLDAVPALRADVALLHVQRADADGNAQVWGLTGAQKESAFAADRVIITTEEIVPSSVVRSDPNRTLVPGSKVTAVCVAPHGAHPSYAQGYYDRDAAFYDAWDEVSRDHDRLCAWLDEWVHGVPDRDAYVRRLGADRLEQLAAAPAFAAPVNYGRYA